MTYETIDVAPVTGALGAEISGVDLRWSLGNQPLQEIHDALMEHQVIFFRDQDLTPEQHIDFGRNFGPLHVHPFIRNLPDYPAFRRCRLLPAASAHASCHRDRRTAGLRSLARSPGTA